MNPRIKALHRKLIATHQALSKRLGKTRNQSDADAILDEMDEVNTRVMAVGRLLFKQSSAEVDKQMTAAVDNAARLDDEIRDVQRVSDVVKALGRLLGAVDKVLEVF